MDRPSTLIAATRCNAALDALLNCAAEGIFGLDRLGRCTFCNASAARMLGYDSPAELVGQRMHSLIHAMREDGSPCVAAQCAMNRAFLEHRSAHDDTAYMWRRGGSAFPVEYWTAPLLENGTVVGTVVSFIDITERKASAHALQHQATHDVLTGLQNRATLHGAIRSAIEAADGERGIAIALIDLDRFKQVNDTLGHSVGDQVLVELAVRLRQAAGPQNTLVRLGGDEFAVVIGDVAHEREVQTVAERLLNKLISPVEVAGMSLRIGASIGIAVYPEHGEDSSALLRKADIAMYVAKRHGAGYKFYQPERDTGASARHALLVELRDAMSADQLHLRFQPQLSLATRQAVAFEAMPHWQHPQRGLLPPEEFMPLVGLSDLVQPLALRMIDQALAQCRQWHLAGHPFNVAIQIPSRCLLDQTLPQRIEALLAKHELPPHLLELQMRGGAMADTRRAMEILHVLGGLGIGVVIDDFGSAYGSLRDLARLRLRGVRIDCAGLHSDDEAKIIATAAAMAHSLGACVIAKGVQKECALADLQKLGCDRIQGESIAPPLTADEIGPWLQRNGG